jgi:hypothetical protein
MGVAVEGYEVVRGLHLLEGRLDVGGVVRLKRDHSASDLSQVVHGLCNMVRQDLSGMTLSEPAKRDDVGRGTQTGLPPRQ